MAANGSWKLSDVTGKFQLQSPAYGFTEGTFALFGGVGDNSDCCVCCIDCLNDVECGFCTCTPANWTVILDIPLCQGCFAIAEDPTFACIKASVASVTGTFCLEDTFASTGRCTWGYSDFTTELYDSSTDAGACVDDECTNSSPNTTFNIELEKVDNTTFKLTVWCDGQVDAIIFCQEITVASKECIPVDGLLFDANEIAPCEFTLPGVDACSGMSGFTLGDGGEVTATVCCDP